MAVRRASTQLLYQQDHFCSLLPLSLYGIKFLQQLYLLPEFDLCCVLQETVVFWVKEVIPCTIKN